MRMIGQVNGARPMTKTRRSVIFRSDGFELVLRFWGSASSVSSAEALADSPAHDPTPTATACFRNERRARVTADFIVHLPYVVSGSLVRRRWKADAMTPAGP